MYAGYFSLIEWDCPLGDYKFWVLYLPKRKDGPKDLMIQTLYQEYDENLKQHLINFSQITMKRGRDQVYETFSCKDRKQPLFILLQKHPLECKSGNPFLMIEWGLVEKKDLLDDLATLLELLDSAKCAAVLTAAGGKIWMSKFLGEMAAYSFEGLKSEVTVSVGECT